MPLSEGFGPRTRRSLGTTEGSRSQGLDLNLGHHQADKPPSRKFGTNARRHIDKGEGQQVWV